MNKEEIENMKEYFNECITKDTVYEEDLTLNYMQIAKEYINRLEQKETILDKVTDKLKEDIDKYNKELLKDSIMSIKNTDLTARILQSQKILNIIEGEKE